MDTENDFKLNTDILSKITDGIFAILIGFSFKQYIYLLSPLNACFKLFMLIFCLCVVIKSRIGYHKSIKKRPYKNNKRFIIDLLILYMYFIIIFSIGELDSSYKISNIVSGTLGIFIGYSFWDTFKMMEYKPNIKRPVVTYFCTLLAFGLFLLINYPLFSTKILFLDALIIDWFYLSIDFIIFIIFWGWKS